MFYNVATVSIITTTALRQSRKSIDTDSENESESE